MADDTEDKIRDGHATSTLPMNFHCGGCLDYGCKADIKIPEEHLPKEARARFLLEHGWVLSGASGYGEDKPTFWEALCWSCATQSYGPEVMQAIRAKMLDKKN
jgi:hypothetical protein